MTNSRKNARILMTTRGATRILAALLLVLGAAATSGAAFAEEPAPEPKPESQPSTQPDSQPTTTATSTTTSTESKDEDEKEDEFLAILNGRVVTVSGPTLRNASILCKNGKIVEIADDVIIPDECIVIDAKDKWIYPGLIAASAGGIHGGGKPDDTTNVFSLNMTVALAGGITTAIAGNDAAKLTFGSTNGMIIERNLFLDINRNWRGATNYAAFRADLKKVRDYQRDLAKHKIEKEDDKEAKPPEKEWLKGKYAQYLKLLKREVTAVASANESQDLIRLAGLAEEFDFRLVIRGAYEAWTVPTILARADVSVILTPRTVVEADDRQNRPSGSSIETAKILADHGIPVAIVPATTSITLWGLAGRDLLHLNMEAAFAVRGGMTNEQAVRAITLDAARVLGIDKRVGSLEVGKDADLIVTDGDVLYFMTQVHHAIVNGKVAYEKEKDTLFAHIRPSGEQVVPDFDDVWPRKLAWPEDFAGAKLASDKKEAHTDESTKDAEPAVEPQTDDKSPASEVEKPAVPETQPSADEPAEEPKTDEPTPIEEPQSDEPEPVEDPVDPPPSPPAAYSAALFSIISC